MVEGVENEEGGINPSEQALELLKNDQEDVGDWKTAPITTSQPCSSRAY
jgi:hypothetical protein